MLPFTEAQVRLYLKANMPGADVQELMEVSVRVHNLRELAERPLTLNMITDQLAFIEQRKVDGLRVLPVDLYGGFVDRWLARDNGKHTLLPEHKVLLMENLAAQFWASRQQWWTPDDLEQWLLEFIDKRADLGLHYAARTPDLWKEDLRTATFLVRAPNDAFRFAHSSLLEYFVSRFLLRSLKVGHARMDELVSAWNLRLPSVEILDFRGQGVFSLTQLDQQRCVDALHGLACTYRKGSSELAFAYGLVASALGYPRHSLTDTKLDGADLSGWRIGRNDFLALELSGVSLVGAKLRRSQLTGANLDACDLRSVDLTGARFEECSLREANLRGARIDGTVFSECDLEFALFEGGGGARCTSARMCACFSSRDARMDA